MIDITTERTHNFFTKSGALVHNCDSVQPALRNFIESFSGNCGFILTCNYQNRLIDPLVSRAPLVEFKFTQEELKELQLGMFRRVCGILNENNVTFDKKVVAALVQKYAPDFRKTLNLLQKYAVNGTIDEGILTNVGNLQISSLTKLLKEMKYAEIREWVGSNSLDMAQLCRTLYDGLVSELTPSGHAQLVLHLANYQYKHNFVADHEINIMAMLTEIMADCAGKWK